LSVRDIIIGLQHHPIYAVILIYYAFYPLASSITWIVTSLLFYVRRERREPPGFYDLDRVPTVSVLIPAYCEERMIRRTLDATLAIDYPAMEVVVVDDASTDGTVEAVMPFVSAGWVRLIRKRTNEGKAMALNDALPCLNGELVLIMDADALPEPDILRRLVPHFRSARVGAVTGNPRVANRGTLLAKLQLMEFASIVSLLRRSQRVWGRMLTMSGVVGIFRRTAIIDAGMYSPEMATEDIDITWKLHLLHYDVRYESRALVWMQVPSTFKGLFKQRLRWARGLGQVLRRHGHVILQWRERRSWPVMIEAVMSVAWAYCMILLTLLWALSLILGYPPVGVSPFPNWWGMLIATTCLLQLLTGTLLEYRYDRALPRYYFISIFYPIIYWIFMSLVTVIATPLGFRGPGKGPERWRTPRE
jgi:biofilm PGA synthesis N-glycosyltransferase PgaC